MIIAMSNIEYNYYYIGFLLTCILLFSNCSHNNHFVDSFLLTITTPATLTAIIRSNRRSTIKAKLFLNNNNRNNNCHCNIIQTPFQQQLKRQSKCQLFLSRRTKNIVSFCPTRSIILRSSSSSKSLPDNNNDDDEVNDALDVLATPPCIGVRSSITNHYMTINDNELIDKAKIFGIIFPWSTLYTIWWNITTIGSIITAFLIPYQISYNTSPNLSLLFLIIQPDKMISIADYIECLLYFIFYIDILINFNLATFQNEKIIYNRKDIIQQYVFSNNGKFLFDIIGVFPFQTIAIIIVSYIDGIEITTTGTQPYTALLFSLLRLFQLIRLHRIPQLSEMLQYNPNISLLYYTLLRNSAAVFLCVHWEACCMYLLARSKDFDDTTWLGPIIEQSTNFQPCITSLYWSIVTFCSVGYGDFSCRNSIEQIFGSIFMLINIVVGAWIIGSITLLIVKGDEKTGKYRDDLETLYQYSNMHSFDISFINVLSRQLRLKFDNDEISDEQVLKHYPSAIRRKALRRLYYKSLIKTDLMKYNNISQQFLDTYLSLCIVEIFSPGEEIIEYNTSLSDLFLLVGGIAEITLTPSLSKLSNNDNFDFENNIIPTNTKKLLHEGDFIGEIGFFTESKQMYSVSSVTICKTLTMSRSAYKILELDHPTSAGMVLQNLLRKINDDNKSCMINGNTDNKINNEQNNNNNKQYYEEESLDTIKDMIQMYMNKKIDDQTTRLLYAASRGDKNIITRMCDNGFDPNKTDYDQRTALMVASMKGNIDIVQLLLNYKADPNMIDMQGSTALYEAIRNGHEKTMTLLLQYGATLCMSECRAASVLCQAVYDGDIVLLRRLLDSGINCNATDYDKRTASHIAAAEGNIVAIKLLKQYGADMNKKDRWNNTIYDEMKRSQLHQQQQLLIFFEEIK